MDVLKELQAFKLMKADSGDRHTALYLLRVNESSSKEEMLHALHEVKFPSYYKLISKPEPPMQIGEKKGVDRKALLKQRHDEWFREHKDLSASELWRVIQSELDKIDWWSAGKKAPDYSFWLRMETWTKEQALLLMFGLEPKRISLEFIGDYATAGVDKAISICEWYEIVTNSITSRKIGVISSVDDWISWFDSKGFEIPKELVCSNAKTSQNYEKKENIKVVKAKQTRVTPWHTVVEDFIRIWSKEKNGEKPNINNLISYFRKISVGCEHPIINEFQEAKGLNLAGKKSWITKKTISNVLNKKWVEMQKNPG